MLHELLGFIIKNVSSLFVLLLLLRFYMQNARISFQYPFGRFVLKMTNFIVLPIRRIVPTIMGLDTASLLMAWLIALFMHITLLMLSPWIYDFSSFPILLGLSLLALLDIFRLSVYLLCAVVIGVVLLSWISPLNRLLPILLQVTEPFLRPLRRLIPPIAGVDISPLLLIFIIQLIHSIVLIRLELAIFQLLS